MTAEERKEVYTAESTGRNDDDDNETVSSSPALSTTDLQSKASAKPNPKSRAHPNAKPNVNPPGAESTVAVDSGNAPPGVRRLVFSTATHKTAQKLHRLPWMTEFSRDYVKIVAPTEKNPVRLFDCSSITTSFFNEDHDTCLIDLYFYDRFVKSGGVEDQRWSPERHLAAWNRFVEKFNCNPQTWLYHHRLDEETFFKSNGQVAVMVKIHCICVNMEWPCAVVEKYKCPMCYAGAETVSLSKVGGGPPFQERLLELTTLLDRIMDVDIARLSAQISEIHQNNRKRDRRIDQLEHSMEPSYSSSDSPSPSRKHKSS
ncbi:hypothetical protein FI667_g2584, partial [Globisporangium splendens]